MHHGLVLGRVLVGFEQDLVELLADRLRASARGQFSRPGVDLGLYLLFLLDRGQGLLQDLGRGFFVAALARPAEVMWRFAQSKQGRHLLLQRGRILKIIGGQIGESEFVFRCKFPSQIKLDLLRQGLGPRHEL